MKWATRSRIHVDRAACAWLIRRFVDPQAEFVFVTDPADVPPDATAFDMRGVALSHHHGRCSFETALTRFDLTADPALEEIGHIVHEADLTDDVFDAPVAAGLDVLIRGLTLTSTGDLAHPHRHRPNLRRPLRTHPPTPAQWPTARVVPAPTVGDATSTGRLNLRGVRLIRPKNAGKPAALNTGIAAARTELLVLLDGGT